MKNFVCVLVFALSATAWTFNGDMGAGTEPLTDGSSNYPWLIEDIDDFDTFTNDSSYWASGVYTELMTDIDLSGRTYNTAVIAPDTTEDSTFGGDAFRGKFFGNHHIISNLTISTTTGYYIGLFGYINRGYLNSIHLSNANISGYDYVGGLFGKNWYSSTQYCHITDCTVNGNSYVGGLCGEHWSGSSIFDSSVSGSVTGSSSVGGLCGHNSGTTRECFTISAVTGNSNVGGFFGTHSGTAIECCATGTVSGSGALPSFFGGFCGQFNGTIELCYATGAIIKQNGIDLNVVGGFCGGSSGDMYQCYSTVAVEGSTYLGGLCGVALGASITDCFWDMQVSGMVISDGGTGKSTAQMQTTSTFTNAGWDFFEDSYPDWMMLREGEDYPRLAWQEVFDGDVAGLYGVDMVDLYYLVDYWLSEDCDGAYDCGRADIDGSGKVGLGDLAFVAADWLR